MFNINKGLQYVSLFLCVFLDNNRKSVTNNSQCNCECLQKES